MVSDKQGMSHVMEEESKGEGEDLGSQLICFHLTKPWAILFPTLSLCTKNLLELLVGTGDCHGQ